MGLNHSLNRTAGRGPARFLAGSTILAIEISNGLPARRSRAWDSQARRLLGQRTSRVSGSPSRPHRWSRQDPMTNPLETFRSRLFEEWLPTFCNDPKRNLDPRGFTSTFAGLAERDAADFMRALDAGVVRDDGGGRYLAARKSAYESVFNHGARGVTPREIRLSLEPVITVATLGRLHLDHGWPKELLGLQPAKWEFDFAAYASPIAQSEYVAGEVKKTPGKPRSCWPTCGTRATGTRTTSSSGFNAGVRHTSGSWARTCSPRFLQSSTRPAGTCPFSRWGSRSFAIWRGRRPPSRDPGAAPKGLAGRGPLSIG